MRIIRRSESYCSVSGLGSGASSRSQPAVVTIGNFDGVHKGHQAMLQRARAKANELNAQLVVLSFDPLPVEFFAPDKAPARLMSFAEKCLELTQHGVDVACIVPFDERLAVLSADEFVSQILVKNFHAVHVVVGDDFRYGKQRAGSFASLQRDGQKQGFGVSQLNTIKESKLRVSSTRIRSALAQGELAMAKSLLGRAYTMSGRVKRGDQRGRTWGFATLNLAVKHRCAVHGVYAVKVSGIAAQTLYGVANIGTRPTVGGLKHLLEVHLFDFSDEVYGRRVCVEFQSFIRGEHKFASFEALKKQIKQDCQQAKNYFLECSHAS